MKPEITVALPMWESGDIAWLCLESLCAQKTSVPWELIIVEEETTNNLKNSGEYSTRLDEAGCVRFDHIRIAKKIPLSTKWNMIARYAHGSSKGFIMCAADNYYQPSMIDQAVRGLLSYDWFHSNRCHFYDIDTRKLVEYNLVGETGIEMSMRMNLATKIPLSKQRKGIDKLIYTTVKPTNPGWNKNGMCLYTVCTHGMNKISGRRRKRLINNEQAPFYFSDIPLEQLLPAAIIQRLHDTKAN